MGELQLLTNSKRATFNDCARKFYFAHELNRRPVKVSEALRFGTLVHKMLEHHFRGKGHVDLIAASQESDPYEVVRAAALMDGYAKYYEANTAYTTVAVEQEYRAPLINPKTGAASRTWLLAGKIDAIVKDADGRHIIVEHKTTSDSLSPDSDYWTILSINAQISGYNVGAEARGHKVDHCLWDAIHKPGQRPLMATPEEQRKFTKDGRLYAAQRLEDETPEEYYDRVLAAIMESPEKYYVRREVVRMHDDIVDYMFDMWWTGLMIRQCQLENRWPRNVGACKRYGTCEYLPVCTNCANIDDDRLFTTVDPNPELSTTNNKGDF